MDYATEVQAKLDRARALMAAQGVSALWLRTVNSVAWITGGVDVAVNTADTVGVASVVITEDRATIWTTTIEAPRLIKEDQVEAHGFQVRATSWEQPMPVDIGGTLGVDLALDGAKDLGREISILRSTLLPVEVERVRALGGLCADAMRAAIDRVRPGMTEWEIAAALSDETRQRQATPIVNLIATDERIYSYRHPLPTAKVMDKYAMLVLCGRKHGLVCSITRLIHYGTLPNDLRRRMQACAAVDAAVIAGSKPGVTLDALFKLLQTAYARAGFDGEWKLHHQGGTAGYSARELLAVPGEMTPLAAGMTCAWNPSITGAKCEDTILVTDSGAPEILTAMGRWPNLMIEAEGKMVARPAILEVVE